LEVSVVSIKRDSKVLIPSGTTKLKYNDIVTLIGKVPNLTNVFTELNDENDNNL
jgi:Trk K+ transport system NAD-binding subunit